MSFDIYGNRLERGFCEVHPHVRQEYPCDLCLTERQRPTARSCGVRSCSLCAAQNDHATAREQIDRLRAELAAERERSAKQQHARLIAEQETVTLRAENERLVEYIEGAPHANGCDCIQYEYVENIPVGVSILGDEHCICWKAAALAAAKGE